MKILSIKRLLQASLVAFVLTGFAGTVPAARAQDAPQTTTAAQSSTPAATVPEKKKEEEDETAVYRKSASVQAFGRALGLNADQAATAFTWLNFLILAGLVLWFLVRTLPKTFRDRNTTIQKQLVDARTATEEASIRLNSVEARLSKLDEQIAGLKDQAEKDSALDEKRIKASVEDEKAKILAAAEQEIATATTHAQRSIQQYAAELAIEQAARKLSISAETDRLLVQNFARKLGGDESKEGQN
ncbi:ATP synthase F0 subunit B [Granulicella sibirica]|uniref:ATP synthase subunit b n=1 Tax=Granulicella sibirica TaxID=2479048 RepID=A0A4Q0SZB7_9BACT|nr:ATP synthase F0 subunit B [Granulicella sibirica]RXH56217.1 ATP synthase F0 sector subunit b [Granulicella sibirica]